MAETQNAPPKGKRVITRSPSHPAFDLQEAVAKAQAIYDQDALNYAPVRVVKSHWGYGEKSSSGMRALAALLQYGFLEEKGLGEAKEVRLSKLAQTILLHPDPESSERLSALRRAALKPKIYAEIWKTHGPKLPSDKTLAFDLETKRGFNRDSVTGFIRDFKATVEFAKLPESGTLSAVNGDDDVNDESPPPPAHRTRRRFQMTSETRPLTIPLSGGRIALLEIPPEFTEGDYNQVRKFWEVMRDGIITTTAEGDSEEPDHGD